MYFIYIDESGQPNYTDSELLFSITALIFHEKYRRDFEKRIINFKNKLKLKYRSPPNQDFELHAKDMVKYDKNHIINSKSIFKGYNLTDVLPDFIEIANLIKNMKCTIITSCIVKDKLHFQIDLDEWCLKFELERLCLYLEKENNRKKLINQDTYDSGIIYFDKSLKEEATRFRFINDFIKNGSCYQQNEYLVEDPVFVDSINRIFIQITDIVSYIIRRHIRSKIYNKSNVIDNFTSQAFELIREKFDTSSKGKLIGSGLKIFPDIEIDF